MQEKEYIDRQHHLEYKHQAMSDKELTKLDEIPQYKEYSAWCHDCARPFIYYFTGMDEPDYECPRCNSNKNVTVP